MKLVRVEEDGKQSPQLLLVTVAGEGRGDAT
jgi:hypothetical protein